MHQRVSSVVIMLLALVVTAAEDSKLRAGEIGADASLGKPFNLKQLYAVVANMLPA